MMKTNELKIGNYLLDDYSGVIEVVNINSEYNHIDFKKPNFKAVGRIELQYIEPIPLNEEWLIRFGFVKSEKINEYKLNDFRICDTIHKGLSWVDSEQGFLKIEHVHTLQNLYFALTGEELTLKH